MRIAPLLIGGLAALGCAVSVLASVHPLAFEPNVGQAPPDVRYLARAAHGVVTVDAQGFSVRVDPPSGEAAFASREQACAQAGALFRFAVVGAATKDVSGGDALGARVSYLHGADPSGWRTGLPTFDRVTCREILPGVDLVLHSERGQPEHDFVVAPGADASGVRVRVDDVDAIERDRDGGLVLIADDARLRLEPPVAWQDGPRGRDLVACAFALPSAREIAFAVGAHDRSRPLVIDPVIDWASFLGGSDFDEAHGVATDAAGNVYVVGRANSVDFPTRDAIQPVHGGDIHDVFVSKLDPTGSTLIWSTFLGGANADIGTSLAVGPSGDVLLCGYSSSDDFPTSAAAQATNAGIWDAFIAAIDATGTSLVFSTYLGGTSDDYAGGIARTSDGGAIVVGGTRSTDFPTRSPLQAANAGDFDLFVTRVDASGAIAWSTYLGGAGLDGRFSEESIAIGPGDRPVVVAESDGPFPTTPGVLAPAPLGDTDVVAACLAADGSRLEWSTHLGGSGFESVSFLGNHVAVGDDGTAWITGRTWSPDFPVVGLPSPGPRSFDDLFVMGLRDGGGSLVASTCVGGTSNEMGQGIALTSTGLVRVAGFTLSNDFPTVAPLQASKRGIADTVLVEIDPAAGDITFSTYLGGTDDDYGNASATGPGDSWLFAGYTTSSDFDATPGSVQENLGGPADAFVARIAGCPDAVPDPVGVLRVDEVAPDTMRFSWTDVAVATSYDVVEDARPDGGFAAITGSAASGGAGLDIPTPAPALVFYRVRAVNGCARGPMR